ncbi:MAG: hypothetical protein Fur0022_24290 [Anaerolineales bacterium]
MITPPKQIMEQLFKAWQQQIDQAKDDPWLFNKIMQAWGRFLERFTYFYQRLLALPRRQKWQVKKKFATTLAGLALLLALGQAIPARAATITVDGVVCTLADAITAANTDTATGGCPAGSGADVIDLQADVIIPTTLPIVWSEMTIEGNDHIIDANDANQILHIEINGNLTINDATLTGGYHSVSMGGGGIYNIGGDLTLNDCIVTGNSAAYNGGGIVNVGGTMTLNRTTVSGNSAGNHGDGGGILNFASMILNDSTVSGNNAYGDGRGAGIYNSGTLTIDHSVIAGNIAENEGAGIFNSGTLFIINHSQIQNNTLDNDFLKGGGLFNQGTAEVTDSQFLDNHAIYGGAIYNAGTLTIANVKFEENTAGRDGGGISNDGTASINGCILKNNYAGNYGGGIQNSGTLELNQSLVKSNGSYMIAGGINSSGPMTIQDSTISQNFAIYGGGIVNWNNLIMDSSTVSGNSSGRDGGGIVNWGGTTTLNNSTVSLNHAGWPGGGILNWGGTTTLNNSTVTQNSADWGGDGIHGGGVILNRSIISGNGFQDWDYEIYNDTADTIIANNYNVIGFGGSARSVGFTPGPKDIIPVGPFDSVLNSNLADNGGPTFTHALVANSAAIDVAPNEACSADPINGADQRGSHYPRNANGIQPRTRNDCDAGAFEYQQPPAPTPTPKPTKTPTPLAPLPTRTPTPIGLLPITPDAIPQTLSPSLWMQAVLAGFVVWGNWLIFRKGRG